MRRPRSAAVATTLALVSAVGAVAVAPLAGAQHDSDDHDGGHCASQPRDAYAGVAGSTGNDAALDAALDAAATARWRDASENRFVRIRGGEFTMGTDAPVNEEDGESPARPARVDDFELQESEVTVAQFARFVDATRRERGARFRTDAERFGWSFVFEQTLSRAASARVTSAVAHVPWWVPVEGADWLHPDGPDSSVLERLDHPVVHVSHNDARAYCAHLGARLARETEFEYAMRGGLARANFSWGDELVPGGRHRANLWQGEFPALNTMEDGFRYAAPVRALGPQNDWGLYHVTGNVWEWVADAWVTDHRRYWRGPGHVLENVQVELAGRLEDRAVERVKRGGSYMCHASYCQRYHTASRSHNTADSSAQNLGLRCARDVGEEGA